MRTKAGNVRGKRYENYQDASSTEAHSSASHAAPTRRWFSLAITAFVFIAFTVLLIAFFHYDRANTVSRLIQSTGILGIVIAVLLMAILSMLPVPSEFFMILIMKVFGPWWGILYSWLGTMLAAIGTFYLARHFGKRLLRIFISEQRFRQVSGWIGDRGVLGLLLVRIIPLPFIVVNYTAGVSRQVKFWSYTWTSAVGGIPYYLGAALVFLGLSRKYLIWLIIGGIAIVLIWIAGLLFNRNVDVLKRWAH